MSAEKKSKAWLNTLIISIFFIILVLFILGGGKGNLPTAFILAESPLITEFIEKTSFVFLSVFTWQPLSLVHNNTGLCFDWLAYS